MHLFFTPDVTPGIYTLSEEESKHAIRVLRLKTGDRIQLIDGTGGFYTAEITDAHQKHCVVKIIDTKKEFEKRNFYLHMAIAPTKNNDRTEWFVEKATETGIDEISLLECDNSERTIIKTERLNKVAVSAIKQSLKAYLPKINEMRSFKDFIQSSTSFSGEKYIAHCYPSENAKPHLKNLYSPRQNVLVLIGPEGDFSINEVKLAVAGGFKEISLGTSRLRTETAALYACTTLNILNHD